MAMVPPNVEVVVSKDGKHVFTTTINSSYGPDVKPKVKLFREKFPVTEGYKVTVCKVECYGRETPEYNEE